VAGADVVDGDAHAIGSRSVTSNTTCDSLIGVPEKILRTSFTIVSSMNSWPAKLNEIFSAGRQPITLPASTQTRRIRSYVSSRIRPLDSAIGMKAPGSTNVPSGLRQRTRTSAPFNRPERMSTIG